MLQVDLNQINETVKTRISSDSAVHRTAYTYMSADRRGQDEIPLEN